MANQPDKRQQFRFWYPIWGNPTGAAASRTPAPARRRTPTNQPKPRSPVQTPTPPTNQSQPIKLGASHTPSPSPSPSPSSSSPSPSSSPAKQNQPRRVSRTPSSPLPSPTQSPSRRSPRLDQVKQNTRDESTQGSKQSPQTTPTPSRSPSSSKDMESSLEASNKQGEQLPDKEPIEPKPQYSKTAELGNVDKPTSQASNAEKEIGSNNSEEIEPKSIPFYPPVGEKLGGTDTAAINRNETDEEKGQENHELEPQVGLVSSTVEEASETQTKEHDKQIRIQNESNQDKSIPPDHINHQENEMPKENIKDLAMTPSRDDSPEETIKEVAKSGQGENPKETIKETTQPIDVNNLSSNYNSETPTMNDNYNYSDHKGHGEIENPVMNNPKHKEKSITGSSSNPTSVQKGIKEGISKLIRKINTENAFNRGNESGTSIITLAGENKGASMYIGGHENEFEGHNMSTSTGRARKLDESTGASSEGTDEIEVEEDSRISANVNSNVQSVNNSMLQESRCDTRDPGVHLRFSSGMTKEKMKKREAEATN